MAFNTFTSCRVSSTDIPREANWQFCCRRCLSRVFLRLLNCCSMYILLKRTNKAWSRRRVTRMTRTVMALLVERARRHASRETRRVQREQKRVSLRRRWVYRMDWRGALCWTRWRVAWKAEWEV